MSDFTFSHDNPSQNLKQATATVAPQTVNLANPSIEFAMQNLGAEVVRCRFDADPDATDHWQILPGDFAVIPRSSKAKRLHFDSPAGANPIQISITFKS